MKAFIAWEGPSPVTGEPIVLIVTGRNIDDALLERARTAPETFSD